MSLNLNNSTARTLVNSTGISLSLAKAVITYKKDKQNHPFTDLKELWKVPGMTKVDFQAICSQYTAIPTTESQSPGNIENPRSKSNDGRDQIDAAKKKHKRKRKKKKKSRSPRGCAGNSAAKDNKTLDEMSDRSGSIKNRQSGSSQTSTNKSKKSGRTGRIQVPNLFFNFDTESPNSTLIRLTSGNNEDHHKVFAPYSVEQSPDGNGLIVTYKETSSNGVANVSYYAPQAGSKSKHAKVSYPATFPLDVDFKNYSGNLSKSRRRHHSNDSNQSRSRKCTTSPPQKRSRISPARSDYTKVSVTVLDKWGSNIPLGPGSSTLKTDISIPVKEAWAEHDYKNVRNWLAKVQEENITDSIGTATVVERYQSSIDDRPTSANRKPLNFDGQVAGPSGLQNTNPCKYEHDTSKKLIDTSQETRAKSRYTKKHQGSDNSRSRHKSRHRWKNKIDTIKSNEEDERRPIESRLDRPRDRSIEATEEMRRIDKQASERRQSRHRHRSRDKSRGRRRRMFNCAIM